MNEYRVAHFCRGARTGAQLALMQVAVYSVIIVTSVVGNGAVICVVYRERHMRTTTNYFIVNLAVCDVMVTSLCTWVHLVSDLTHDWLLGAFFCKFNSFAQGKPRQQTAPAPHFRVLPPRRFNGLILGQLPFLFRNFHDDSYNRFVAWHRRHVSVRYTILRQK